MTSPPLMLSGFGFTPPPGPPDQVDGITATVRCWLQSGGMQPLAYELRDASGVLLAAATGIASTDRSHQDVVSFATPGLGWDRLAGLQLWIYADPGSSAPGLTASVDYASLSVAYVPSGTPYAVPRPALATAAGGVPPAGLVLAASALAGPAAAIGAALAVVTVTGRLALPGAAAAAGMAYGVVRGSGYAAAAATVAGTAPAASPAIACAPAVARAGGQAPAATLGPVKGWVAGWGVSIPHGGTAHGVGQAASTAATVRPG
jgi:hypothetical protein